MYISKEVLLFVCMVLAAPLIAGLLEGAWPLILIGLGTTVVLGLILLGLSVDPTITGIVLICVYIMLSSAMKEVKKQKESDAGVKDEA